MQSTLPSIFIVISSCPTSELLYINAMIGQIWTAFHRRYVLFLVSSLVSPANLFAVLVTGCTNQSAAREYFVKCIRKH